MITRIAAFGLIIAAGLVVSVAPASTQPDRVDDAVLALVGLGIYAAIGGLIVFRRDGHLTVWLLTLVGLAVITASELPFFPVHQPGRTDRMPPISLSAPDGDHLTWLHRATTRGRPEPAPTGPVRDP